MPLAPIEPRPDSRTLEGGTVRLRRWQAQGSVALLLLLPTRPELTAGYDAYALALCGRGVDVALVEDFMEPGAGSLRLLGQLVPALRPERRAPPFVLGGHGDGAIVVGEYLATELPQPDLVAMLAPSLFGASPPSSLDRLLPWKRSAPPSELQQARDRVIALLSTTSASVFIESGWQDPLVDRDVMRRLQDGRPIGDVWNLPVAGHDLPNVSLGEHGDEARRGEYLANWIVRRASERWPEQFAGTRPPGPASLDRVAAAREHAAFVATESDRLRGFEELVRAGGGPPVDPSAEGLTLLGGWLYDAIGEGPRDGPVPAWAVGAGPERRLSGESLWLIDGAAAFLLASLREAEPDTRWELCKDRRDAYYHQSLLQPLHLPTDVVVANLLRDLLAVERPADDWLARRRETLLGRLGAMRKLDEGGGDPLPLDEVAVEAYDGDAWNAWIWIPEGAEAVLGRERFEALGPAIAKLPGVRELAWEDREVMLVRLDGGTDHKALRRGVLRLLRAAQKAADADEAGDADEGGEGDGGEGDGEPAT